MKFLIISLALLGTLAATPAIAMDSNDLSASNFTEGHMTPSEDANTTALMPDRPKKSKAGKHGGYGKKAAKNRAKGSKCGDKRNRRVRGR